MDWCDFVPDFDLGLKAPQQFFFVSVLDHESAATQPIFRGRTIRGIVIEGCNEQLTPLGELHNSSIHTEQRCCDVNYSSAGGK